jgi:hypothetical protein
MFERPLRAKGVALVLWRVALLLFIPALHTVNAIGAPEAEPTPDQLLFVPPPVQGVISLGVYDNDGKLIRVLKKAAELDSFKVAADGLVIDWDKTDGSGKQVPNGKYFARGVMVGDFTVQGVAFHLNAWIDSTSNPRVRKIISTTLLDSLRPAAIAEVPQSEIAVLDTDGNQTKAIPLAFNAATIKTTGPALLVFDSTQLMVVDPVSGSPGPQQTFPDIRDADALGDRIVVLSGNQVRYQTSGVSQELKSPAEDLFRCAMLSSSIVVASKGANIWRLSGQEFVALDSGETGELLDMNAGAQDSVWLLVKTTSATLLKQIDSSGKLLREIELPPELRTVARLGAARDRDALLLISENGPTQQVIGIRFQTANRQKSIWEKWFDRSLTTYRFFDLKDGKVVPADTRVESPAVFVKPANDPMENTRQAQFQLSAVADDSGAWITDSDGLPLIQVCTTTNIKQTRCVSDGANGLRVYVSDGTVVEEYHLPNLENLFRFDAGSFD